MAQAECRDCGREVASETLICPHCGVPNPAASGTHLGTRFKSREEYERWKAEKLTFHTSTESPAVASRPVMGGEAQLANDPTEAQPSSSSGGPLTAARPATGLAELQPSSSRSSSGLQPIGFGLLGLGFAIVMFFFAIFDTSIQVPTTEFMGHTIGGGRVNNLGLMNQRQNGIMVGALVCMVGLVLVVVAHLQPERAGTQSSAKTGMSSEVRIEDMTKKCPDCAEQIKLEALVCRFCGHRFEPGKVQAAILQAKAEWEKEKFAWTPEKVAKLSVGVCPNCEGYMAFDTNATKNLRTCQVCGAQYPLVLPATPAALELPDQHTPPAMPKSRFKNREEYEAWKASKARNIQ